MEIAFRTDASLRIGSGHVMRCLTLAEALRQRGATCYFICREQPGNLLAQIRARGFAMVVLQGVPTDNASVLQHSAPQHYEWLGSTWEVDAEQTLAGLKGARPDWLIVDHYALDRQWEGAVRHGCKALMVIDDLADRPHSCDLLLDPNLGRTTADYSGLVSNDCTVLTGPRYALLRPEFVQWRAHSLARHRTGTSLHHVMISMGGVDQENATSRVLQAVQHGNLLPQGCSITVVMGPRAPWLRQVMNLTKTLPWRTDVAINVEDMARRMAASDLAIGAAGGTAWERCCLGLPTLLIVLAENQWPGARALHSVGAARLVGEPNDVGRRLGPELAALTQGDALHRMSFIASTVTDGLGLSRLIEALQSHGRD